MLEAAVGGVGARTSPNAEEKKESGTVPFAPEERGHPTSVTGQPTSVTGQPTSVTGQPTSVGYKGARPLIHAKMVEPDLKGRPGWRIPGLVVRRRPWRIS